MFFSAITSLSLRLCGVLYSWSVEATKYNPEVPSEQTVHTTGSTVAGTTTTSREL